jgi:hypothetical protein
MQYQVRIGFVNVLVDLLQATRIKGTCSTDDAVNFVPFCQQQFSEVGTVLASDASD